MNHNCRVNKNIANALTMSFFPLLSLFLSAPLGIYAFMLLFVLYMRIEVKQNNKKHMVLVTDKQRQ